MGRLSKIEKMKEPQHTEQAQEWMKQISVNYESNKKKFYKMCRDMHFNIDEDVFSETVLMCYDSISRNGLQDLSQQGCENYLFKAFRTNIYAKSSYDKRKVDGDINSITEKYIDDNGDKVREQVLKDYTVIYLLNLIEENFDEISFSLWRLKYMVEKMSYEKLRNITGVKDCKKRIIHINEWLRENVSKEEILKNFEEYFDNLQNCSIFVEN